MNNLDLPRWQRFVNAVGPFYALWRSERKTSTALRAELDKRDATIGEMRIDLAVAKAHLDEAVKGRERAMAIAKELGGAPRWNEADDVWMRSHGVQP